MWWNLLMESLQFLWPLTIKWLDNQKEIKKIKRRARILCFLGCLIGFIFGIVISFLIYKFDLIPFF